MSKPKKAIQEGATTQTAPRRVLIVEDEMMLALLLEDTVVEAGHEVRKAGHLSNAFNLIEAEHFDAAILDVNLDGEKVFPLAVALRARGIPMLFASGYGDAGIPEEFRAYAVLQKPYSLDVFHAALRRLLKERVPNSEQ